MISIISGSGREDNNTIKVANEYHRFLAGRSIESGVLSLAETAVFVRDEAFRKMEDEVLKPASRFIIIMPEYNGSYPGLLKLMIDNTEVSKVWWHKKVLLTGVATGRAGNLRGMEHLTGALLHMKMIVHPNRLPISMVNKLMDADGRITDVATLQAINTQLDEFLSF